MFTKGGERGCPGSGPGNPMDRIVGRQKTGQLRKTIISLLKKVDPNIVQCSMLGMKTRLRKCHLKCVYACCHSC